MTVPRGIACAANTPRPLPGIDRTDSTGDDLCCPIVLVVVDSEGPAPSLVPPPITTLRMVPVLVPALLVPASTPFLATEPESSMVSGTRPSFAESGRLGLDSVLAPTSNKVCCCSPAPPTVDCGNSVDITSTATQRRVRAVVGENGCNLKSPLFVLTWHWTRRRHCAILGGYPSLNKMRVANGTASE